MGRRHWIRLALMIFAESALVAWYLRLESVGFDFNSFELFTTSATYFGIVYGIHAGHLAYEFAELQRSGTMVRPSRTGLRVLLGYWWPVLVLPPVGYLVTICALSRRLPASPLEFEILGLTLLAGLASGLFGLGLARWLPMLIAVPAAGATCLIWFLYPGGTTNALLRNLNAEMSSCCVEGARLSDSFLAGSGVLMLVIIIGTLAPFWGHRWINARTRSLALWSVGTVIVAFAVGSITALALGPLDLDGLEYEPAYFDIDEAD